MFNIPSKNEIEMLRQTYPAGTRVELISMDDEYSKLKPGDRGVVKSVDDIGTVHCAWDCGSGLGLAYGEDQFRKLTEQELAEEQETKESEIKESNHVFNI